MLPVNFTCTDCTIRLLRQASEWGGAYRFWSCADVIILPHPDATTATCAVPASPAPSQVVPNGEPEPVSEGEPEPISEGEPEPISEGEPEPVSEHPPTAEPELPAGEPEPTYNHMAVGEPEPVAENQPTGEPEPSSNSSESTSTPPTVCIPESALTQEECFPGKCLNGGTCDETTGTCSCLKLFSGDRCEEYGKFFVSKKLNLFFHSYLRFPSLFC